jgi:modulator of FtsH protease
VDAALAGWDDFFLGTAGAAAALAGLLFVAISINVREILADAALPARAGETIVFAVAPLALSLLVLMPDQSVRVVGVEVLIVGTVAWLVTSRAELHRWRRTRGRQIQGTWSIVVGQVTSWGALIGGLVLVAGNADGLYVVAVGIALSFVVAVLNGWVLLVEILR